MTSPSASQFDSLMVLLRQLKLSEFAKNAQEAANTAERNSWTFGSYLHHLAQLEADERRKRRVERFFRDSHLPEKTRAMLRNDRIPPKVLKQLPALCEGGFVDRAENLLVFGLPGRGKTHLVCAIGHELIQREYRIRFVSTYGLVQQLLAAKRDLKLERALAQLDAYDAVILDDIGYVQQNREEMEVLFTFFAQRYERKSVIITSNLVFSEWGQIFKDPMTTAAAIDRLVHHSILVDMSGPSIRNEEALERETNNKKSAGTKPTGVTSDSARTV